MKQAEQQRKQSKDMADIKLKQQQQQIEAARIAAQAQLEREKLAANAKAEALRMAVESKGSREKDALKMGVDILKQISSQKHQQEMQRNTPKPTKGK